MPPAIRFLCVLVCFGFAGFVSAQSGLSGIDTPDSSESFQELTDENRAIFSDPENDRFFVDFESLRVNLNDVVVKAENGEILLQDNVFKLPVDTIYEIDFSAYKPGTYVIELRSFTGVFRKKVYLN